MLAATLTLDQPVEDEADERLCEGLHREELAVLDRLRDRFALPLADELGDPRVDDHDLDGRDSPAADARQQPLADHAAKRPGEHGHDLRLLFGREELDETGQGLGRVDRVERREHEMTRLRCLQRHVRGLGVAKLAYQDHVGVLTQDPAERLPEAVGVDSDLALVDDAVLVLVQELDRILDRDDVLRARAVDVVDHGRERRGLPGAGRARHEDEPSRLVREPLHSRREPELVESCDRARDAPECERDGTTLAKAVHSEAREIRGRVCDVELARLVEGISSTWSVGRQRLQDHRQLVVAERREDATQAPGRRPCAGREAVRA